MNKVVHFEIPASDLEKGRKFYQTIFGWKFIAIPGFKDFYMIQTVKTDKEGMPQEVGGINGDMSKRKRKGEPTTIVVNVPSIDNYFKKITKTGGKIIAKKQKIGKMGFYARVKDPEGNLLGLWEDTEGRR